MYTQASIPRNVFALRFNHLDENDPWVSLNMPRAIFLVYGRVQSSGVPTFSFKIFSTCVALSLVRLAF